MVCYWWTFNDTPDFFMITRGVKYVLNNGNCIKVYIIRLIVNCLFLIFKCENNISIMFLFVRFSVDEEKIL